MGFDTGEPTHLRHDIGGGGRGGARVMHDRSLRLWTLAPCDAGTECVGGSQTRLALPCGVWRAAWRVSCTLLRTAGEPDLGTLRALCCMRIAASNDVRGVAE